MYVKISKEDALKSIGFALTSAEEEYERTKSGVGEALQQALQRGLTMTSEDQQDMARALTHAREAVLDLRRFKAMAEFATDAHGVLLDVESFELLRPNLPAR